MILIYNDLGVSQNSATALLSFVQTHFPDINCKTTNNDSILADLPMATALLMPGGADRFYQQKLAGAKNQGIKSFVKEGGIYIGICAGAYYGCTEIEFTGKDYAINDKRELGFFKAKAVGSLPELTHGHYFSEHSNSKAVVTLSNKAEYYYHGGCYFEPAKQSYRRINYQQTGQAAVVYGRYKKGAFLLSGVHFEFTKERYQKAQFQPEYSNNELEQRLTQTLPRKDHLALLLVIKNLLNNNAAL